MTKLFVHRIFRLYVHTGGLRDRGCHVCRGHRQRTHPNLSRSVYLSSHMICTSNDGNHEPISEIHVPGLVAEHEAAHFDVTPHALATCQNPTEQSSMVHFNVLLGLVRVCVKHSKEPRRLLSFRRRRKLWGVHAEPEKEGVHRSPQVIRAIGKIFFRNLPRNAGIYISYACWPALA
jgi:hypothetical protein